MGQMSVLMALRKVCNHPDLFEPRPIESPFQMSSLLLDYPAQLDISAPSRQAGAWMRTTTWATPFTGKLYLGCAFVF